MSRAALAVFALVLAGHGCAADNTCLQSGHLPEGKSLLLPSQRKNITTEGGQTMPLGLANAYWASAKILTQIMRIISEEVLGYHAQMAPNDLGGSSQSVYALGNCPEFPVDCLETEKARDPDGSILSQYHFVFEIYENYVRDQLTHWEDNYPEKAPEVIGTVGYVGDEGIYLNPKSFDQGLAEDNLILDYYRGFNTSKFNATALSSHFTPLDRINSSLLFTCDELMANIESIIQPVLANYHGQFPNDTSVSWSESAGKYNWQCDYEGIWWLSPACRNEPMTCIPVVTHNIWGNQFMQQATYFNMPIAFASTTGECGWNCEWKEIVGIEDTMPPMTFWWFPDDMFIKSDLKLLAFPPYNKEEYEILGLQASQLQSIPLYKLMAKGLGNIAGDLALVARELWVPLSNIVAMLKRSFDGEDVSDLACQWVQENTELWHNWLPGELECNPGQGLVNMAGEFLSSNADAISCGWCEPGTYSDFWNGTAQRICWSCPAGAFQNSPGQTECESCSPGKFTASQGHTACAGCDVGTYAEGSDNTACTSCSAHETTMIRAAETSWDCVCDEGYFRALGVTQLSSERTDCLACPSGMECEKGNDAPNVLAGFWVSEQNGVDREYSVYRCRDEWECPGGEAGTCAAGRDPSNIGCASCMLNYRLASQGECTKCDGNAWLSLIGVIIIVIFGLCGVAFFARVDVTKIRMNTVSVAICMSQTVMIIQTMSLFFTMKISWIDPVKSIFSTFSIAAFNFSALNLSCGISDSDVVSNYALRLLSFPLGVSLLCTIFAIMHFVLRQRICKDHVINSIGVLTLVLFLILNMTALTPFHCISSPNGTSSLSTNPSVICYDDAEWTGMAVMGTIAVLFYGVGFFSFALFVTIQYPKLVISAHGSIVMSRYRFMFQRFTAKCYYFTPIYLIRTLFIALIPVIFADYGHRQMIFLVLTMVVFSLIHAKCMPWRGAIPNMLDVWVMGCMVLLLTCSALLLEVKKEDMVADLEAFFTAIMVFVFGAIGSFLAFLAYRRFVPSERWAALLCHIPDTAVTARWLKMEMEKRIGGRRGVFLAADNLDWNLEDFFDLLRCQMADKFVILLSGGTLSSPQCAGQIATALTNGVTMVPVALDSFTELGDEDLDQAAIAKRWSAEAFQRCTAEGISLAMVKDAYTTLRGIAKISCRVMANRLANSHGATLRAIAELSSTCGAGNAADSPEDDGKEYAVGVVADVYDSEAIAMAEVLKNMIGAVKGWKIKGLMQDSEVRQAQTPSELLLVVLTRGCLGSESFMQTATAVLQAWPSVPMLAVKTDDFSFPTEETMQKTLAPQIAKGAEIPEDNVSSSYATLLASPSVSFSAKARISSLQKQVGYVVVCAEEVVTGVRRPSMTGGAEEAIKAVDDQLRQETNEEPKDPEENGALSSV